ncbi:VWA-like domain-containing protein [Adlercreutzia sp. R21]|uniref:vWA domain-containing protein n=1 Tax=Adlercreutzia wanghongyangiae TaxID=3111451 RepID=UPI002DB87D06|nr:VWA-like domain-containing protein [Adlercreutzia sp. R21]MEC4183406.1 VWA-like domain-containing protein [Adlercreutzia sp. R21]
MEEDQRYLLAMRVTDLAKAKILAEHRYLSVAAGHLTPRRAVLCHKYAVDGEFLYIDSSRVLDEFRFEGAFSERDYLHSLIHCIFLHPFAGEVADRRLWNLACDMAAECLVSKLCGRRPGKRGERIDVVLRKVGARLVGGTYSAEEIYGILHAYCNSAAIGVWESLFAVDDHGVWFGAADPGSSSVCDEGDSDTEGDPQAAANTSKGSQDDDVDEVDSQDGAGSSNQGSSPLNTDKNDEIGKEGDSQAGADGGSAADCENCGKDDLQGDADVSEEDRGSLAGEGGSQDKDCSPCKQLSQRRRTEVRKRWQKASFQIEIDLQTFSRDIGEGAAAFVQELGVIRRKRIDLRDFLRYFGASCETLKASDDEFDYIFYAYGLELYKNIPLIEPLEYSDRKKIRNFVIAIDTSGSVYGAKVKHFVEIVHDVLVTKDAFARRTRLHILQCDADISKIDIIESPADLRHWLSSVSIYGGGGTDFRPAFRYADVLCDEGRSGKVDGLLYLTDGEGIYPSYVPKYKTAFVFYEESSYEVDDEGLVPPWAIRLNIRDEDLK